MKTNQEVPQNEGEIVRCINESLALKYRYSLEEIKDCTNKNYKTLYMLGGGIQSKLLCQMTANACDINVSAGPIEATVLGNIAIQLMARNEIKDLKEARQIIKNSQDIINYYPTNTKVWNEKYDTFKEIIESKEIVKC